MAIKKYLKYLWLYDTAAYLEENRLQVERRPDLFDRPLIVELGCKT